MDSKLPTKWPSTQRAIECMLNADGIGTPGNSMAKAPKKTRLRRSDWIEAGLWLLAEEGVESVTIDRLCTKLELTKGSFYWHFKGRQEFLQSMAAYWSNTAEFLETLSTSNKGDWEQISEIAQRAGKLGYGRVDKAMRIWAETSSETAESVKKTDQQVIKFVFEKLVNIGLPRRDATTLSEMIVACGVGLASIDPSPLPRKQKQREELWLQLIQPLTKKPL
jgi:AcrR family transcriptional regulator